MKHFSHKCRNGQVIREHAALLDQRDVLDRMIAELKRQLEQLNAMEAKQA